MSAILETSTICGTIIDQLGGGRRLQIMCGVQRIVTDEAERNVRFKVGKRGANIVRITLEHDDTYTVELIRQNSLKEFSTTGLTFKVVKTVDGVYAEELRAVFTEVTGLELSL